MYICASYVNLVPAEVRRVHQILLELELQILLELELQTAVSCHVEPGN